MIRVAFDAVTGVLFRLHSSSVRHLSALVQEEGSVGPRDRVTCLLRSPHSEEEPTCAELPRRACFSLSARRPVLPFSPCSRSDGGLGEEGFLWLFLEPFGPILLVGCHNSSLSRHDRYCLTEEPRLPGRSHLLSLLAHLCPF